MKNQRGFGGTIICGRSPSESGCTKEVSRGSLEARGTDAISERRIHDKGMQSTGDEPASQAFTEREEGTLSRGD